MSVGAVKTWPYPPSKFNDLGSVGDYAKKVYIALTENSATTQQSISGTYEPILTAGTNLQYYRGDKTWATLNQAAVPGTEPTITAGTIYQLYRGNKTWQDKLVADVRDYGAVGDGVADDTDAINAAIATGKTVVFGAGTFMTTGGHHLAKDGQKLIGEGWGLYTPKTTIKKSSGTNFIVDTGHTYNNMGIENILFDRNSLNGSGIIWRGHYSLLRNIYFKNTTGTGVDLHLSGVNTSKFDRINAYSILIDQSSDTMATPPTYGCLYSSFSDISFTTLELAGSTNLVLDFKNIIMESCKASTPGIWIHGTSNGVINFDGISGEPDTLTAPWILVDGANIYNVHFRGGRLSTSPAQTQPVFKFKDCQGISVSKILFNDYASLQGRHFIEYENIKHAVFDENQVTALNNFYFLFNSNPSPVSEYVTVRRNKDCPIGMYVGTGTNYLKGTYNLILDGDSFVPSIVGVSQFVNISGTPDVHSQRSAGQIVVADEGYYDIFGDGGANDPGGNWSGLISISTGPTSKDNFALFYAQTSSTPGTQTHSLIGSATGSFEPLGSVATHAALSTGIHGLAITAGQTLTVTGGGTIGSAAYTSAGAYEPILANPAADNYLLKSSAAGSRGWTDPATFALAGHNHAGVYDPAGAAAAVTVASIGAAPAFTSGAANCVWATPNGAPGVPSLRALVSADIPALSYEASGAVSSHNGSASAHGFTTAGKAIANLTNPAAVTFLRVNADNTASLLSASDQRTALGLAIGTNIQAYNSNLTGINQALDTTASPAFVTVKCSGLTDGYFPYHVDDSTGFANSVMRQSSSNIGVGIAPFAQLTLLQSSYLAWEVNTNAASRRWWIANDQVAYGDFAIRTEATKGNASPDTTRFYISPAGLVYNSSNSQHWDVTSDARAKKNISSYAYGLKELLQLNPKTFEFNGKLGTQDGKKGFGLIAQDVEKIIPEAVHAGSVGGEDVLNMSAGDHVHYMCINAIRELESRIAKLEKGK